METFWRRGWRVLFGLIFVLGLSVSFLVPAVLAKATAAGPGPFEGRYYNNMNLSGTPVLVRTDQEINFNWGDGSPAQKVYADHFSARWARTASFQDGLYKFTVTADDGVRLFLDNKLIIDKWKDQPATTYTSIKWINAGMHTVRMEYYENGGVAFAGLDWQRVSAGNGFVGAYYDNSALAGTPTQMRVDSSVNFDWGQGSPMSTIPADNFSARWTRTAYLNSGLYQFTVTADDGVRLYLDNKLILDKWKDQPATTYTVIKWINAGQHPIQMEYYERGVFATAKLDWKVISAGEGFVGAYYDNMTLSGTPTQMRVDPSLSFDWGQGAPMPTIPADNFSVRWTRTAYLNSGLYQFTVTADDGVRLYLDGKVFFDKWKDQPATTYSVIKWIDKGQHTIQMEYYEHGVFATAKLNWKVISAGEGFVGAYYDNMTLSGTPTQMRVDPSLSFDWGQGAPMPTIPADNFSVRWTRTVSLPAGQYQFTVTADDGVRLYLDNKLILDKWKDQPATTYTVIKWINAGQHVIQMEYYEHGVFATAKLSWKTVTGGFVGAYYDNMTLAGTPTQMHIDPSINFDWGKGSPDPTIPADHFSARWNRNVNLAAGTYRFTVTADDGVRLYVDGKLVIDQWKIQAATTYSQTIKLASGNHPIVMEYYENDGMAVAKMSYQRIGN